MIPIINKTMDLGEVRDRWFLDETYHCWCLEDVLYTLKATTPKFQRLSIFVPAAYMRAGGVIDEGGTVNGYTAATAPVILANNSAGYMQMPHMWLGGPRCTAPAYLERGFVYVTCGNRGHESRDAKGSFCGKAPANLVDLKTVIRFLRHNAKHLPGDLEKIVSVGTSAGGAMSSLLAVTGNNANYGGYLKKAGAFLDERDDVFAAQMYCPIIDLEHADLAYEWMFHADKENEASHAGPAGTMTAFEDALSAKLKDAYVDYFNGLGLTHPGTDQPLVFGADGRSGSMYEYVMRQLNTSATKFLGKLSAGQLPQTYSVEDYIKGSYTFLAPAPMGEKKDEADLMQSHAPGVGLKKQDKQEPMGLGELLSRPPKGTPAQPLSQPPMVEKQGADKTAWLTYTATPTAMISDLDTYVLSYRRRMKPCTSFDILSGQSGENKVFGKPNQPAVHFNAQIADAIAALKEAFSAEYEQYHKAYEAVKTDEKLDAQKYLMNPMNFIGTAEASDYAKHFRIRVGAFDADTSFTIAMALAVKLANAGQDVDYALVWDQPHCEADYPGELLDWIEGITR